MTKKSTKNKSKGRICGIYIRCSTKDQESDGQSLQYQEEECLNYMKQNKLAHMNTYKDIISGSTRHSKRPGMTDMFNDIKDGLIDGIVVWSLDRLCRDLDAGGEINCFLSDNNITLYQVSSDADDSTFQGKTQIVVQRLVGQMELNMIKERTRVGKESKRKRLGWVGARVPFGYTNSEDRDTPPYINHDEAETVRLIYKLYWSEKGKISSVVRHLNNNKIPVGCYNKSGKWGNSAVIRILSNHYKKYKGGLINDNENNIRWDVILDEQYPVYPKPKKKL